MSTEISNLFWHTFNDIYRIAKFIQKVYQFDKIHTGWYSLTVNPSKQNLESAIKENTSGQGVDVAFEAVGLGATAQQTLQVTRNKGTVVWIGNNARMIEIDMQAIVTRELSVLGSYGMSEEEFKRSIMMLADGSVPADKLITRRAVLTEGPDLFDELLASPETIKCVINL